MSEINNTQTALDAGRAMGALQFAHAKHESAPFVVVPAGYKAEILDLATVEKWLPKPPRKKGTFNFADADSFVRYFMEHRNPDSRIFAAVSDSGGTFKGILNFHGGDASFNDHVCIHTLAPTTEWARWTQNNKNRMSQVDFATFLEDNASLFVEPSGADLLELIRNLEGHSNVAFNSAVKLQNGSVKLAFDEEVQLHGGIAGSKPGTMELPQILNVGIAPFQGGKANPIKARLRYRIESRKITFWYETIDAHLIVRAFCQQVVADIAQQTGVAPFLT